MLLFSLKQIRKHFARSIIQWSDAGTGLFALTVNAVSLVLAWIFVPLERGYWQDIRANRKRLYPHVNFDKPTASDVIRIFLQSLLLCLVQVFSWEHFKKDKSRRSHRQTGHKASSRHRKNLKRQPGR